MATISFTIDGRNKTYEDEVFDRPMLKRNLPAVKAQIERDYQVGSKVDVRYDGDRSLLKGFPESYANLGIIQLLGGIVFAVAGISGIYSAKRNDGKHAII